jgi:hypothetical protein
MKNIKTGKPVLFAAIIIFLIACNRTPDGYYDFVNKENVFSSTIYEFLKSKPQMFDSLVAAIDRDPRLKDVLSSSGNASTIFAPVNNNFKNAVSRLNTVRANNGKTPLYINTVDPDQLDTLLSRYIVKGIVTTDSIIFVDGLNLFTYDDYQMQGQKIYEPANGLEKGGPTNIYFSDTKGGKFFIAEWSRVETQVVNIHCSNGVVHILVFSHEFGFDEFLTRMDQ